MVFLGYVLDDIVFYLGLDVEIFVFDVGREGIIVYFFMCQGVLKVGVGVELKL